jgi:hypothetical protein
MRSLFEWSTRHSFGSFALMAASNGSPHRPIATCFATACIVESSYVTSSS